MWRLATIVLIVLLAMALVPAMRHLREVPPPPDPALRLALEPPANAGFGTGTEPFDLAIAPSGREVVFVGVQDGDARLWRQPLDAGRAEVIPGSEGATQPAYSRDGAHVFFFAQRTLRRVTLATGDRHELGGAPAPAGIAARADGTLLFAPRAGPIVRLTSSGAADVTTLHPGERAHAFPAWIDDSDAFVYLAIADDGRRTVRLHDGSDDVELTRADSNAVPRSGFLVYVQDRALRAAPFDVARRRLGPRAATLALDVGVSPSGRGAFAAGEHLVAWAPPAARPHVLQWFSLNGTPGDVVTEPGDYWQVRLSPDERTAALTALDPLLRTLDVFRMVSRGGALERVTLALAADTDPVWSPRGDRLAFRSLEGGRPEIRTRAGMLHASALDEYPTDWTGSGLYFHARSAGSGFDVWSLPEGGQTARPVVRTGFNEVDARVSPNGRWIAYASDEPGQFDVYVARLDDTARRVRVSMAGGTRPHWTSDSSVMFLRGTEMLRAELEDAPSGLRATMPRAVMRLPGIRDYAVARSRRQLLAIVQTEAATRVTINVLVGWRALAER